MTAALAHLIEARQQICAAAACQNEEKMKKLPASWIQTTLGEIVSNPWWGYAKQGKR